MCASPGTCAGSSRWTKDDGQVAGEGNSNPRSRTRRMDAPYEQHGGRLQHICNTRFLVTPGESPSPLCRAGLLHMGSIIPMQGEHALHQTGDAARVVPGLAVQEGK